MAERVAAYVLVAVALLLAVNTWRLALKHTWVADQLAQLCAAVSLAFCVAAAAVAWLA